MTLAQVLDRYNTQHAANLPSKDSADKAVRRWVEFFGVATLSELTVHRQEEFVADLRRQGLADGTIKRTLGVGTAALNRAHERGELLAVPHIITVEGSQPRDLVLDVEDLRCFWQAIEEPHLRHYFVLLVGTGARPSAVLDLTKFQVDLPRRLLDLNPAGRRQTKKRRPIIRICYSLVPWLKAMSGSVLVSWKGRKVDRVTTSWEKARARAVASIRNEGAGLARRLRRIGDHAAARAAAASARERGETMAQVTAYTIRHTVATWLDEQNVPENEIASFLGHRTENRATGWYINRRVYREEYQANVAAALDRLFAEAGLRNDNAPAATEASSDPIVVHPARAISVRVSKQPAPESRETLGAGEGIRTLDPNLGKVVLYP